MTDEQDNFDKLLDTWESCCKDVAEAENTKDFNKFKEAMNRGNRAFLDITRYCEKNDLKLLDDEMTGKTKNAAAKWLEVANSLECWKEDIAKELKQEKSRTKREIKILKHYHFSGKKTGINLKMKAK